MAGQQSATNNSTLHFFCGKMAAGKSTLANKIALQHQSIILSEDNWLTQLYPNNISTIADYIKYSKRLKKLLFQHISCLLKHGNSVVMDFPGNTVLQRSWFRALIDKHDSAHVLHFIDKTDALCKIQLKKRNDSNDQSSVIRSEADFDAITQYFEAPDESEGFNIIHYSSD